MPKKKRAVSKLRGKVSGGEKGDDPRDAGPVSDKRKIALTKQNNRTKILNGLASDINRVIRVYGGAQKSRRFYHDMLKRLRKETLDNRYLLLLNLKGLNINSKYPFHDLDMSTVSAEGLKNKIAVNLKVNRHARDKGFQANCYYYEVLLMRWERQKEKALAESQYSEWIYMHEEEPEFEFLFPRTTSTQQWLLSLRIRLGKDEVEVESFHGESMQIIDAGTFLKEDEELWKKREEEKEKEMIKSRVKRVAKVVQRVKRKKKE